MTGAQRVVIVVTGGAVGALAVVFAALSWDRADQVAGVVSALVGVAGLGAAVWAVLAGRSSRGSVRVSDTGRAVVSGAGDANTGVISPQAGSDVVVERTGDAQAEGGNANTGYREH
ncbi:hypothetical protein [Streptomyces sp. NPDC001978]|uniref:hypothetical protein n=1 Tax=Streptomyces sp. NPDC001978 TaxID=3364627 RepID=UPI003699BAAB